MTKILVCFVSTVIIGAVLLYALYRKGDVRAELKVWFIEFSLDAKQNNAAPRRSEKAERLQSSRNKNQ